MGSAYDNDENSLDFTTVDFTAVQADDELLDLISHDYPSDEELAQLLSSWRNELSKSLSELIDLDTACAVITASCASRHWWKLITQVIWFSLFVLVLIVALSIGFSG